jgi:hypothetical protein
MNPDDKRDHVPFVPTHPHRVRPLKRVLQRPARCVICGQHETRHPRKICGMCMALRKDQ